MFCFLFIEAFVYIKRLLIWALRDIWLLNVLLIIFVDTQEKEIPIILISLFFIVGKLTNKTVKKKNVRTGPV